MNKFAITDILGQIKEKINISKENLDLAYAQLGEAIHLLNLKTREEGKAKWEY